MLNGICASIVLCQFTFGQMPTPTNPPGTLPPTITNGNNQASQANKTGRPNAAEQGASSNPTSLVQPAAAIVSANDRYKNIAMFPPDIGQCVFGVRAGSDWLSKMHQASGRVLPGVNPALAVVWNQDSEAKQALATWGMCRSARFMGDTGLSAKSSQSLLAIYASVKPDTNDQKRLTVNPSLKDRTLIAASIILAIAEVSKPDDRSLVISEHMAAFLATNNQDQDPLSKALSCRALVVSYRAKPTDWKLSSLTWQIESAHTECRSKFNPVLAGGAITAATELFYSTKDKKWLQVSIELADQLIGTQYDKSAIRGGFIWAGAFKTDENDTAFSPTFEMSIAASGMISASQLTKAINDVNRFPKYRASAISAITFVHGLQATPDSSMHFDSAFRMRSIVGGVRASVNDGILRADATALAIDTFLRFTESGLDQVNE
jgi:hypothetical protein